jgi:prevent-host-death family protein
MATVGIRELKNRLSEFLKRVADGERVTVTDRGRPVAVISPPAATPEDERVAGMVREGVARWGGGKPRGSPRPSRIQGKSIAQTVVEERR